MKLLAVLTIVTPHVNYVAILPELILIGGALLLLVSGQLVFAKIPTAFYSIGSGAIAAAALVASLVIWHDVQARGPFTTIADSVAVDGFAIVFLVLVSCILILASAIANDFLVREGIDGPEYHVLALLAGSGAMLMAAANDLILIFVALEIMSIPLYILAGWTRGAASRAKPPSSTSSSALSRRPSSCTGSLLCTGRQGRPISPR